jgi:hypothetical protein
VEIHDQHLKYYDDASLETTADLFDNISLISAMYVVDKIAHIPFLISRIVGLTMLIRHRAEQSIIYKLRKNPHKLGVRLDDKKRQLPSTLQTSVRFNLETVAMIHFAYTCTHLEKGKGSAVIRVENYNSCWVCSISLHRSWSGGQAFILLRSMRTRVMPQSITTSSLPERAQDVISIWLLYLDECNASLCIVEHIVFNDWTGIY